MHVFLTTWKDAGVPVSFFVAKLDSPPCSLHHGMDSFSGVRRIGHMLFGEPCWMNREGLVDLVSCALMFWESVGCPAVQQYRWFGVFAAF